MRQVITPPAQAQQPAWTALTASTAEAPPPLMTAQTATTAPTMTLYRALPVPTWTVLPALLMLDSAMLALMGMPAACQTLRLTVHLVSTAQPTHLLLVLMVALQMANTLLRSMAVCAFPVNTARTVCQRLTNAQKATTVQTTPPISKLPVLLATTPPRLARVTPPTPQSLLFAHKVNTVQLRL